MNARQHLDQVTGKITELERERQQALQGVRWAEGEIATLRKQIAAFQKKADLTGGDASKTRAGLEARQSELTQAVKESTATVAQLAERVAALRAELPRLRRAAATEQRDELLAPARAKLADYRKAATAFVEAAAAAQRALAAVKQVEAANELEGVISVRLLTGAETESAIKRAVLNGDPGLDALFDTWKV